MEYLFKIVTERVELIWHTSKSIRASLPGLNSVLTGRLVVTKLRKTCDIQVFRTGVPSGVSEDIDISDGPIVREQTDYQILIEAKNGGNVELHHSDPNILGGLKCNRDRSLLYGAINFQSQIGRSRFTVTVNGEPEFAFEIEVFPVKLDYQTDYKQILSDVQNIMTGLALEYLRSTFKLGKVSSGNTPSELEWLILLNHISEKLASAIKYISGKPIRKIVRQPQYNKAERVKKLDSRLRKAILRGAGNGPTLTLSSGVSIKSSITETHAYQTLDTPEHRWIKTQLSMILQKLAKIKKAYVHTDEARGRQSAIVSVVSALESKLYRLVKSEFLSESNGQPPAGFTSLQLIGAPGYREAFEACTVLSLGLKITDGPLNLSVKDLSLLYEYWCFLALVRLIAEETRQPVPARDLFKIQSQGLKVMLSKGTTSAIVFKNAAKNVVVQYNPLYSGTNYLTPQQPDMLVTLEDDNWKHIDLVIDAKYRLDASPEYKKQYNSFGPPEDALNVLYRYRDAIIEVNKDRRPRQTIIQGAALFPYREDPPGAFEGGKLWTSLIDGIGLGAIPFLPGNEEYLRKWIRSALSTSGWSLSEKVVSHMLTEQAQSWKQKATEPVLLGPLAGTFSKQHLDWVRSNRKYYIPLSQTKTRQFSTKAVAIYSGIQLRSHGALTHLAEVENIEIALRRDIKTPWASRVPNPEAKIVVYHLKNFRELERPIENIGPNSRGVIFVHHRWTSRLALERAGTISELLLETEPEWNLLESLKAVSIRYKLQAGDFRVLDPDDPKGRAWFVISDDLRIRYSGEAGFMIKNPYGTERFMSRVEDVVNYIASNSKGEHSVHE